MGTRSLTPPFHPHPLPSRIPYCPSLLANGRLKFFKDTTSRVCHFNSIARNELIFIILMSKVYCAQFVIFFRELIFTEPDIIATPSIQDERKVDIILQVQSQVSLIQYPKPLWLKQRNKMTIISAFLSAINVQIWKTSIKISEDGNSGKAEQVQHDSYQIQFLSLKINDHLLSGRTANLGSTTRISILSELHTFGQTGSCVE